MSSRLGACGFYAVNELDLPRPLWSDKRSMKLPLHDLFQTIGKTLFGEGPMWKAQFAYALGIRIDTVAQMAGGKLEIPERLWKAIERLIDQRADMALLTAMK